MRAATLAILGSLLTAAYWWVVFMAVYADGLFGGDGDPARQPAPDGEVLVRNGSIIVVALLIYAGLSLLWRRVTTGRRGR